MMAPKLYRISRQNVPIFLYCISVWNVGDRAIILVPAEQPTRYRPAPYDEL